MHDEALEGGDALEREMERLLDEYRGFQFPCGPIPLSDEYLRLVAEEEGHPDNQSGADKTWVERARRAFRDFFASVE